MSFYFQDDEPSGAVPGRDLPGQQRENPLSVTQINSIVKGVVDDLIPEVWIAGEITDISKPQSGHVYFSIKDGTSTVRAVMWRTAAIKLGFQPADGMHVVGHGRVDVYVPRGTYQIVFRILHPIGEGGLQAALRKLHAKLEKEGLFSAERKKIVPRFPQRIGFVTSPSGAAIRDFLEMMRSRWPSVNILVIPASVQGENAPAEIVAGIRFAERLLPKLDALIVGRGGGSVEDLWHFNDERVVRAVADCSLPTISAVGHEIDVTLCDLAADMRALTPSDAAVRCIPDRSEVASDLSHREIRLANAMNRVIEQYQKRLFALGERPVLLRPSDLISRKQQLLDESGERLQRAMQQLVRFKQQKLDALQGATQALSPLAVLARGYSITRRNNSDQIIRSITDVSAGQFVETVLADGTIDSKVMNTREA
jgi:exodeoxyribonuclease VII large subunit